jgi:uncharacterized protein YukE
MEAGRISYQYAAVGDVASNTSKLSKDMVALFEQMRAKVVSITGEALQGQFADAFNAAQAKWNVGAMGFASAQSRCAAATDNAAMTAHTADLQAAGNF